MPSVRRVRLPSVLPLPALPAGGDDPVGDHVHRRVEVEVLPLGAVRPAVEHLVLAGLAVVSCRLAEPFGHSRPRLTGESGSPSIWVTFPSWT